MRHKIKGRFFSLPIWMPSGLEHCAGRVPLVTIALLFAVPVFAQLGPPAGQSQGTPATVNTLSPNVQVQGVYAGSTPGVANMPFNGKLGLGEAIQRGLAYNLGQ